MPARQQAEELQSHREHEQSGDDRQNALAGVERAAQEWDRHPLRCAYYLAKCAGKRAQKAVGRQSAEIVEQVALECCTLSVWIAAQRTGEAAAHTDAVEAACETSGKDYKVSAHRWSALLKPRLAPLQLRYSRTR